MSVCDEGVDAVTRVPLYGFKRNLDHVYPENWSQEKTPTFKQLWTMIPLIVRYLVLYVKLWWKGRTIVMDFVKPLKAKQIYGVPLGGLGSGSIGRGFRGEFCRFQMIPGVYEYDTVDADQFIVTIKDKAHKTIFQSLLSTYQRESASLTAWESHIDSGKCKYTGLYPRAWTEYNLAEFGVKLTCRQISPVVPHNYKDSSIPCGVFVWEIENVGEEVRHVTIAFTIKNGCGNKNIDKKATCCSKAFSYLDTEGVILYNTINMTPCAYAVSTKSKPEVNISKCLHFDPCSDGRAQWQQLHDNGKFDKIVEKKNNQNHVFGEMACGVASQIVLQPSTSNELEFVLVWDMPVVGFPEKQKKYTKFYTKYFGVDTAILKMVAYAIKHYRDWEKAIYDWQIKVLDDPALPDWYKGALFNETYYVSDGGTVWFKMDESDITFVSEDDPRLEYGRFSYLEGHEYRMYNSYDVHFYASQALAMNWPHLQLTMQYDFKDAVFKEDTTKVHVLYNGETTERKVKFTVPHDLGDPCEEPFVLINAYPILNVSEWRDLNSKFVLQVFRDYCIFKDLKNFDANKYLEHMYKACHVVMCRSKTFDVDGDGLIENTGQPDQTYDSWIMTGSRYGKTWQRRRVQELSGTGHYAQLTDAYRAYQCRYSSAYCGGLWLAALYAMTFIADKLNKIADRDNYQSLLYRAKEAYEKKLWNGKFYEFDSTNKNTIMADQLCGFWYLKACGTQYEVFPERNVKSTLNTIFENNVMSYRQGTGGAINGYLTEKKIDPFCLQSEEVWIGVTYALAATMIYEDMLTEAWQTAGGMYQLLNNEIGLAFETPEAICKEKYYRSIGYMRPLAIWAMQHAWESRKHL